MTFLQIKTIYIKVLKSFRYFYPIGIDMYTLLFKIKSLSMEEKRLCSTINVVTLSSSNGLF